MLYSHWTCRRGDVDCLLSSLLVKVPQGIGDERVVIVINRARDSMRLRPVANRAPNERTKSQSNADATADGMGRISEEANCGRGSARVTILKSKCLVSTGRRSHPQW